MDFDPTNEIKRQILCEIEELLIQIENTRKQGKPGFIKTMYGQMLNHKREELELFK